MRVGSQSNPARSSGAAGASIVEYLFLSAIALSAVIMLPSLFTEFFRGAHESFQVAGGGSSSTNSNPGSIVERDCAAAYANGIVLDGCPCGTGEEGVPNCPAFYIELRGQTRQPSRVMLSEMSEVNLPLP